MKYNQLKLTANLKPKRVGRGIAAGQGKTAGRGTKGQMARTGATKRPGFSGGQNPLMQQLPKLPGFRSRRVKAELIFTHQLEQFSGKTVDAQTLAQAGLISSPFVSIKVLSRGELTKSVSVQIPAASASAISAIQNAGGSFTKTARLPREAVLKTINEQ